MRNAALHLGLLLACGTAAAGEFTIGLGADDIFDQTATQSAAVVLEYHHRPFSSEGAVSYAFAGALQFDGDDDLFIGAGVHAHWNLVNGPWFLEASFMPGYYAQGAGGTPLGGNLQFRSLIGIGRQFNDTGKISISIDHKSNADTKGINPGSETLSLRYTYNLR